MTARARWFWASALLLLGLLAAVSSWAVDRPSRDHQVYFAGTPDELHVYRVYGLKDGKTIMLIGGIQGDEPGGFLSADLYADISLAKGNLIVVPRANYYSIILNHRGPDGDMNRQFGDPVTARRHKKIVAVLKGLMAESDLLLNLHDGSGFFRPEWESPMANPKRYGQSLIADTGTYTLPGGKVIDLAGLAERVLNRVNPQIEDPRYRLLFNNHRTASQDSLHKEQRRSATFYALTQCGIPAYGVETSKSLPDTTMKVRHHNLVINAFMDELGIVPENPGFRTEQPSLRFLVVSVNERMPMVLAKDAVLKISPGDKVSVAHIEANYERGLTCDFEGLGSVNDLRHSFFIHKPTRIVVRKDHQRIGQVHLELEEGAQGYATVRSKMLYFLVDIGGERRVVANGEVLKLVKGDVIRLVEVLSNLHDQSRFQVNFKGYVPPGQGNEGEDRGYSINTGTDLMSRYAQCAGGAPEGVECYRVVVNQGARRVGEMSVELAPAKLDYVVIRQGGGPKLVYHNGETMRAAPEESIQVVDLKSNVRSEEALDVVLTGPGVRRKLGPGEVITGVQALGGQPVEREQLRLVVMRQQEAIGHVLVQIGGH